MTALFLNRSDVIPSTKLRNIAEALDAKWTRHGGTLVLMYVVGLLACYAGSFLFRRFISTNPTLDVVGIAFHGAQFVFMFGTLAVTWRIARRGRCRHICHIMLQHLRCPHCGYDLHRLPTNPKDRATVCPECGCAWQGPNHMKTRTPHDVPPRTEWKTGRNSHSRRRCLAAC